MLLSKIEDTFIIIIRITSYLDFKEHGLTKYAYSGASTIIYIIIISIFTVYKKQEDKDIL